MNAYVTYLKGLCENHSTKYTSILGFLNLFLCGSLFIKNVKILVNSGTNEVKKREGGQTIALGVGVNSLINCSCKPTKHRFINTL